MRLSKRVPEFGVRIWNGVLTGAKPQKTSCLVSYSGKLASDRRTELGEKM